jgi:hypothetical protein
MHVCHATTNVTQEVTLDEYEAMLAEKKAALNKARTVKEVDTSEFANLKAVKKDEEEAENPLEVRAACIADREGDTHREAVARCCANGGGG